VAVCAAISGRICATFHADFVPILHHFRVDLRRFGANLHTNVLVQYIQLSEAGLSKTARRAAFQQFLPKIPIFLCDLDKFLRRFLSPNDVRVHFLALYTVFRWVGGG
jgi:hypothetical protein